MSEWKEYRLGDLISKIVDNRGKTPPVATSGRELLEVNAIGNRNPDYSVVRKYVSEDTYNTWFRSGHPTVGDILIPTVGSVGIVSFVTENRGCIAQNLIALRFKEHISSIFIYYYLSSSVGKSNLLNLDIGGVQPSIKVPHLLDLGIPLPTFFEQERIAGILSSLDDKIDLLGRQNATLEAMAETLFRQYFIENPKPNWKDGVIADIIDFNPIRKLSKDTIAPFLEMSNLSTNTYAPNGWYDRAFSSGTKFKNGDTLLARITPCLENGKTAYIDFLKDEQIAWGSTEYIVMRPKGELHPFFAYIIAKYQDFRDYAESCMSGSSGRQRVDVDNLKGYEIKIPDPKTIEQFNVSIESIVGKTNCNNNQIRSLTKLRDTLLPKLMNNEIRIQSND